MLYSAMGIWGWGETTLTRKGQLTVPKSVVDYLGLRRGDQLDVQIEDEETVRFRLVRPPHPNREGSLT